MLINKKKKTFIVAKGDVGMRIDRWLLTNFTNLNNSLMQKLIRKGDVRLNNAKCLFNQRLEDGDVISLPYFIDNFVDQDPLKHVIDVKKYQKEIDYLLSNILYKDDDILIINKPSGLAVQGGSKIAFNITHAFEKLKFESTELPMIVHRIDKETSGVLVLARHKMAARYMMDLFKNKNIQKTYHCIIYPYNKLGSGTINAPLHKMGDPDNQKIIVDPLGKTAITNYDVKKTHNGFALVQVMPITGRTHQIRVHMAQVLNAPIVGDYKYGFKPSLNSAINQKYMYLHASEIAFKLPSGNEITIKAPMEDIFLQGLEILKLK
jgi:23S rRNA pseudouridine955/2504/2580 synthase